MFLQVFSDTMNEDGYLGTYCGSSPPPTIVTKSNVMYIQLYSDNGINGAGFSAQYEAQCWLVLSTDSGTFMSLDRDQDGFYDNDLNCTWHITADEKHIIYLQFEYVDTHSLTIDNECWTSYRVDILMVY